MTIKLDDMRVLAAVVSARSFTGAARALGLPKQTVSRRVAALEAALGQALLHRTTRTVRPTELGSAYARRCEAVIRLADEANAAVVAAADDVTGTLRITADPLFGEAFLPPLLAAFVRAHPAVTIDAVLTQRRVDLIAEGFDVAFRVGALGSPDLIARKLGPATVVYAASPDYLAARGVPASPAALVDHDCILLVPEGAPDRWLFATRDDRAWLPVAGRIRVDHFATARALAVDGLGIANLPAFACAAELDTGRLVPVLSDHTAPFGDIHLVLPSRRHLAPRTRRFVDHAVAELRDLAATR